MKKFFQGIVLGTVLAMSVSAFAAENVTELKVKNYQIFAIG